MAVFNTHHCLKIRKCLKFVQSVGPNSVIRNSGCMTICAMLLPKDTLLEGRIARVFIVTTVMFRAASH